MSLVFAHRFRSLCRAVLLLGIFCSRTVFAQEQIEYYGTDAIGSVRIVFDASGTVTSRMDYGAFGEALQPTKGTDARVYAQLFGDAEIGKDFAQARHYDNVTGRFLRTDPILDGLADPQRWNRYTYALNNPVTRRDPAGMSDTPFYRVTETVTVVGHSPFVSVLPVWMFTSTFSSQSPAARPSARHGGSGGQSGDNTSSSGEDALPEKVADAINNAYEDLKVYKPDQNCSDQVITRLKNFSFTSFQAFLGKGAHFYNGPKSDALAGSIFPTPLTARLGPPPGVRTIKDWFARVGGLNALTSTASEVMTVYLRPGAVDTRNGGVNARNRGLLFHEGLHAFGHGAPEFVDQELQQSLGLSADAPSVNISTYISKNCN